MKTHSVLLTLIFLFNINSYTQVQFCGPSKIDKINDYCHHLDVIIECTNNSIKTSKINSKDKDDHQRTKDDLSKLKEIIKDGVLPDEKNKINSLLNNLLNKHTFCTSKKNNVGKKNNEILISLKSLVDKNIITPTEPFQKSDELEIKSQSVTDPFVVEDIDEKKENSTREYKSDDQDVSNNKGINWFGWFFFIAFLISMFIHFYNYLGIRKLFIKRIPTNFGDRNQREKDEQSMDMGVEHEQNENIFRYLHAELKEYKEENEQLRAKLLDLKNDIKLKNSSEDLFYGTNSPQDKMIELLTEPNKHFRIIFHHDIETDGKSLKIAKATNKQTPMSLYEIRVENDNNIRLWVIESPQVTKMLIDYCRKQLEPLFNIPFEPPPSVSLIKNKLPATFKKEGEFWVLEEKGSVEYI